MSNRANFASADKSGAYGCRSSYCAWALAILIVICTSLPGVARADALVLTNGEVIEGSIVEATRNTVIVRRSIGGMRQMRIQDIVEIRILVQGETIAGKLLGWAEGVHRIGTGGEILRVGAGGIIERARPEQATAQPPRSPSARMLPQRPRPPVPAAGPPVRAAIPAAAADVKPAEFERVEVKRAQTATAGVAPATDAAAEVAPTKAATGKATAAAAPIVAGPAGFVAPVKVAAVVVAATTPGLVAIPRAAAAEMRSAKVPKAPVDSAAVAGAMAAPAGAGADEAAVRKVAAKPEAESDGQPVEVRASVDPAEPGAAGVLFRIELSRPAEQAVVLIYGTLDGTAVAGQDYEPQEGMVTLDRGTKSAGIRVPLIGDRRPRGDTQFELFVAADPKVAKIIDQRVSATIPAAD